MKFKEGDYVKITAREVTPNDIKSGTFYPYYCGLAGTVDRIYDKEICIKIDLVTLPESMLKRHLDVQESIRKKWLNNLSGEARNRLTPEEKKFDLSYTILVQMADLEKAQPGTVKPVEIKNVRPANLPIVLPPTALAEPEEEEEIQEVETAQPVVKTPKVKAAKPKAAKPKATKAAAKAESSEPEEDAELTPAELEFLKEREQALKGKK